MPLLCPVLWSGPNLDMGRRESPQKPQRALLDAPDGVSDPERCPRPSERISGQELLPGHETTDEVVDETTARTHDYNERNNQFTGQIDNVTVERK